VSASSSERQRPASPPDCLRPRRSPTRLDLAVLLALALGVALMVLPFAGRLGLVGLALVALAAALRPDLGLLAVYASLPLTLLTRLVGPLALNPPETALLASALGQTIRWLSQRRSAALQPVLHTVYAAPIALFLLAALLSLLVTQYPRLSFRELRLLVLEPILAFALLRGLFPTASDVLWPLGAFLLGAVAVSLGGLLAAHFGLGVSQAEGVWRLQAAYLSANQLALLLERALPFLLALALPCTAWRLPLLAASAVVTLALGATFSLGGWLAAALGAALVLSRARLPRRLVFVVAGLGLTALLLVAALRPERVLARFDPAHGTGLVRLNLWQSSLRMLADHPLLGVGLDNFLYEYQQRYILPEALSEANLSHPHNWLLNFWLSLGLLGLVASVWLVVLAFRLAWRTWQARADRSLEDAPDTPATPFDGPRLLALGAAGSLVAMLVHGSVDNSYFLPDLALAFWLLLAVLEAGAKPIR
jgi:O-antigen ligase